MVFPTGREFKPSPRRVIGVAIHVSGFAVMFWKSEKMDRGAEYALTVKGGLLG
jgi:hypothetical protein